MLMIGNSPNFFTSPKGFPFRYEIPDYDIRGQAGLGLLGAL